LYVSDGVTDGAGYTTNIRIGGTDTSAVVDTTGPAIQLYLDRRTFRPGDLVGANPLLLADLQDASGINTSGAGLGHRIEAWLDGQGESVDLSPYYRSKVDTYQEGTVEYPLAGLGEGSHTLLLKAWDTHNNSATSQTVFNIMTGSGLQLSNVFNYPNPATTSTLFTFQHNQLTPIDVTIKVYTVAGRVTQSLSVPNVSGRFVKIPWDLRDMDGDVMANGVYLYKIIVKTSDRRFTSESIGKMSILK
jgi:hypothetical protein